MGRTFPSLRSFGVDGVWPTVLIIVPKEVLIQPLDSDRRIAAHADAMFNHQIGQFLPIDKDDALGQILDVVSRRLTEGEGSHENASGFAQSDETADKAVHIGRADGVAGRVVFRLDTGAVEAEAIPSTPPSPERSSCAEGSLWLPP